MESCGRKSDRPAFLLFLLIEISIKKKKKKSIQKI